MSYRLTDELDWETITRSGRSAQTRNGLEGYMIFQFEHVTTAPGTLDQLARVRLRNSEGYLWPRIDRVDNRSVNGIEGYVLEGHGQRFQNEFDELKDDLYYEFGAVTPKGWAYLTFEMPKDNAKYRRWIESVLASIEWK